MRILFYFFIYLFILCFLSCTKNDVCNEPNALECPSGDFDGDGISNGEDPFPKNNCKPNKLSFEDNFLGRWAVKIPQLNPVGSLIIIEKGGTYQDPPAKFLDNENVVKRTWSLEKDSTMNFEVVNRKNETLRTKFKYKSYTCDTLFCRFNSGNQGFDTLAILFIRQ